MQLSQAQLLARYNNFPPNDLVDDGKVSDAYVPSTAFDRLKVSTKQTLQAYLASPDATVEAGDSLQFTNGSVYALKDGGTASTQADWIKLRDADGAFAPLDENGFVPLQNLDIDCGQLSDEIFWLTPSEETIVSYSTQVTTTTQDLIQTFNASYRANTVSVTQTWAEGFPLGASSPVYSVEGPASFSNGVLHAAEVFDPNDLGTWQESAATLSCTDRGQTETMSFKTLYQTYTYSPVSQSFVAGSLRKAIYDRTVQLKGAKNATASINRFSTRTFDGSNNVTFTLNSNFWAASQDVTCVSIGNSADGQKRGATLVSPRHIIMAQHYSIAVGARIYFSTADGTLVTRTLSSTQSGGGDLLVGRLDSDVPGTITPAQVLTTAVWTKAPALSSVPQLLVNQFGEYGIRGGYYDDAISAGSSTEFTGMSDYLRNSVMYDSGQPGLLLAGTRTVLTFPTHWSDGRGQSLLQHHAQVNSAMTSLGGGYQLTALDLTPYNSY